MDKEKIIEIINKQQNKLERTTFEMCEEGIRELKKATESRNTLRIVECAYYIGETAATLSDVMNFYDELKALIEEENEDDRRRD